MFRVHSNFTENMAWATLFANVVTFAYFLHRTMDGLSVSVGSPRILGVTIASTIVLFIILVVVLAIVISARQAAKGAVDLEADERDKGIMASGEKIGGYALGSLVVIIIFMLLGQYMWPDRFPIENLVTAPVMIVLLLSAMFLSEIIKCLAVLILYRR